MRVGPPCLGTRSYVLLVIQIAGPRQRYSRYALITPPSCHFVGSHAYDSTPCSRVGSGKSSCKINAVSAVKVGPPCWGTRHFTSPLFHLSAVLGGTFHLRTSPFHHTHRHSCVIQHLPASGCPITRSACYACTAGRWSASETAPLICPSSIRHYGACATPP